MKQEIIKLVSKHGDLIKAGLWGLVGGAFVNLNKKESYKLGYITAQRDMAIAATDVINENVNKDKK